MHRKAKSGSRWERVGMALPPYFYCNLKYICELLHVLIIKLNPKGLEVHLLGSTQGHTTIFELALLIDN